MSTSIPFDLFKTMVELSTEACGIIDSSGCLIFMNKAYEKLLKLSLDEARKIDYRDYCPQESIDLITNEIIPLLKACKSWEGAVDIFNAEGERLTLQVRIESIMGTGDQVQYVLSFIHDITGRKRAEETIELQSERLRYILEGTNVGTWEWNVQTGETVFNERWAGIIGYTLEEISPVSIETWIRFTHPDDLRASNEALEKHFRGEADFYDTDCRMRHKDGSWVWVHDRGKVSRWSDDGRPLLMSGTHQDITGRKLGEETIKRQLKEKEILLKEVHHRIKNNIASIEGLLYLQSESVRDDLSRNMLLDAISRVQSMRVIYDKLLLSDDYMETSARDYLEGLIDAVVSIFPESRITFRMDIDDIVLDVKQLFPMGTIVNELITNSMKYGFTCRDSGNIDVILSKNENEITLTVQDNGVGLPEDFDAEEPSGFGLMIVKMLAEQLGGEFSIQNNNGARAVINFKV